MSLNRDVLCVQGRDRYQVHVRTFHDSNGMASVIFRVLKRSSTTFSNWGSTRYGSCHSSPRRCATMATTSRITTLSIPAMEHWRISASSWVCPRPRDPGHYRNGAESHLRSAPVVSRVAEFAGQSTARWYVWSDTDRRYKGVRIIFLDTETSNWAWDPISKSFYWHRFFSHSPISTTTILRFGNRCGM